MTYNNNRRGPQMGYGRNNNYERQTTRCQCPYCGNNFTVDGNAGYVECPYCGEVVDLP